MATKIKMDGAVGFRHKGCRNYKARCCVKYKQPFMQDGLWFQGLCNNSPFCEALLNKACVVTNKGYVCAVPIYGAQYTSNSGQYALR